MSTVLKIDLANAAREAFSYGWQRRDGVTYAHATAGTGSRYAVVVASLPGKVEGGDTLITVLAPVVGAYVLPSNRDSSGTRPYYHPGYLLSKLAPTLRHPGDQMALALLITIAWASEKPTKTQLDGVAADLTSNWGFEEEL